MVAVDQERSTFHWHLSIPRRQGRRQLPTPLAPRLRRYGGRFRRRDNTPERPAERAAERAAEHLARETRDAVKVKCAQAARKRWKEMKEHTPASSFQKAMKPSKGSRFAFASEESRQMLKER
ncbi:unnamed protein product [Cladocopium goreaui]|uniref:Uncharacterized protein n=1 Tax=Cladocopium goreaui TaxID=2562237 RepID=A0A9P1C368_9DINO|nr:unnamed protein product [Cladocopium goreaui]